LWGQAWDQCRRFADIGPLAFAQAQSQGIAQCLDRGAESLSSILHASARGPVDPLFGAPAPWGEHARGSRQEPLLPVRIVDQHRPQCAPRPRACSSGRSACTRCASGQTARADPAREHRCVRSTIPLR
jgi:hypothetical protein